MSQGHLEDLALPATALINREVARWDKPLPSVPGHEVWRTGPAINAQDLRASRTSIGRRLPDELGADPVSRVVTVADQEQQVGLPLRYRRDVLRRRIDDHAGTDRLAVEFRDSQTRTLDPPAHVLANARLVGAWLRTPLHCLTASDEPRDCSVPHVEQ